MEARKTLEKWVGGLEVRVLMQLWRRKLSRWADDAVGSRSVAQSESFKGGFASARVFAGPKGKRCAVLRVSRNG